MGGKIPFALVIASVWLLMLPLLAGAATYELPLRTATIVLPGQYHYSYAGQADEPYQLLIDPLTLRVGYDAQQEVWYESFVIADAGGLRIDGADLHLSEVSSTALATFSIQAVGVEHTTPDSADFAWRVGWGLIIDEPHGFLEGLYSVQPSGLGRYQGWCLCADTGYGEFAGIGGANAPHATVYAVPEPSAGIVLLVGLLVMLVPTMDQAQRLESCRRLRLSAVLSTHYSVVCRRIT